MQGTPHTTYTSHTHTHKINQQGTTTGTEWKGYAISRLCTASLPLSVCVLWCRAARVGDEEDRRSTLRQCHTHAHTHTTRTHTRTARIVDHDGIGVR